MSCLYCGGVKRLGTEHLVPRTRGGLDIPENLFKACGSCNASKSDRLPSEWRDDLPIEIYALERHALSLHPKVTPRAKDLKTQKQKIINIRCTEAQKELLEKVAASEGMGPSTWLLSTGLRAARQKEDQR